MVSKVLICHGGEGIGTGRDDMRGMQKQTSVLWLLPPPLLFLPSLRDDSTYIGAGFPTQLIPSGHPHRRTRGSLLNTIKIDHHRPQGSRSTITDPKEGSWSQACLPTWLLCHSCLCVLTPHPSMGLLHVVSSVGTRPPTSFTSFLQTSFMPSLPLLPPHRHHEQLYPHGPSCTGPRHQPHSLAVGTEPSRPGVFACV